MAAPVKRLAWQTVGTFIGQVTKRNENWKAAHVRVKTLKLDERLSMVCNWHLQ